MKIITNIKTSSYVGNSAADFGERGRTTIFSAALRRLLVGEKDWSWSFALNSCFLFVQAKRKQEV